MSRRCLSERRIGAAPVRWLGWQLCLLLVLFTSGVGLAIPTATEASISQDLIFSPLRPETDSCKLTASDGAAGDGFGSVAISGGTGRRVAEAYDGAAAGAPLLHVEYVSGGVPLVTISAPGDEATLNEGITINFAGTAVDDQDGDLTASLSWESSLDGPIGSGGSFSRADLSTGGHVITATVTDSDGLTGHDSVQITVFTNPPLPPVLVSPADAATGVSTSPSLEVTVFDPKGADLTVTFYGRPAARAPDPDFTLIALPDTQFYTDDPANHAYFGAQTQWVIDNRAPLNTRFVTHLGDVVEDGNNNGDDTQWLVADAAMGLLEDPVTTGLADGIPFGLAVGNHDIWIGGTSRTASFNKFFGVSRFQGRGYYGGHYGALNDNNFELFSTGRMDFIIVHFDYASTPDPLVLAWADGLLKTYSSRRAIAVAHNMIEKGDPGSFSTQGQAIYDALKDNPNLFLMLGGHNPGEGRREDVYNGNTVYSLLSDYQGRPNGGNGWLRMMEFSPTSNEIRVKTYSPVLDRFETDADSQFTLSYGMQGVSFQVLGTNTGVPSGSNTSITWPGLASGAEYEWYVTVDDGNSVTTGTTWSFTTEGGVNQPPLAANDAYTTGEDTPLSVAAPGVLGNDSDADGDALTAVLVSNVSHGSLALDADGSLCYDPNPGFVGTDSFTYKANDGPADSSVAEVQITVTGHTYLPLMLGHSPRPAGLPSPLDHPMMFPRESGLEDKPASGLWYNTILGGT